jgi:cytosine/adenosine deaminase-related metal-dependent hydrolase
VIAGVLGDRIGRRSVMLYTLIFYCICTLGAAAAPNYAVFVGARVLAGLGAESAIIAPFLAEFVPPARRGGVKIAYGSDLLGGMHRHQSREFRIRAQVQKPAEVITSATLVAADLLNMSGEIGRLLPGARADLLLLDGDPVDDLAVLAEPADHVLTVVQDGAVVVDRR